MVRSLDGIDPEPGRALVLATWGPIAVALALLAWFIVLELAGQHPFSETPPRNMAEAAAQGMGAEVLRRLRAGEDPAALLPVDPSIISSSITRVTALEASIWGREIALVRLLDREGAIRDEAQRSHLACLAHAARSVAIERYLAPQGVDGCDTGAAIAALEARR